MSKKVILLNGAPNSGKDTVAIMLLTMLGFGKILAFKDELYKLTAQMFGIDLEKFKVMARDRILKEKKNVALVYTSDMPWYKKWFYKVLTMFGVYKFSPRDALIYVSEKVVKPKLGQKFFGSKLAQEVLKLYKLDELEDNRDYDFIFVPDSGFLPELEALLDAGLDVTVIRIHREGATFEGDSRSLLTSEMLDPLGVKSYDITNDGTLAELEEKSLDILMEIIRGRESA